MEDADAGLFACDRKPKTAEEAPDRWIGDGSHGNEQVGDPPPSTTEEAVLCFQYGEMRHFFGDCPLINSWKSDGSVSWDWDTPCPTKVPVRRRDIAEYHSWRTGPLLGVSFLELYTCWLLKEVSEQKHPGDGYTTEHSSQVPIQGWWIYVPAWWARENVVDLGCDLRVHLRLICSPMKNMSFSE